MLARALTWANVIIGIYNSLPGIPLDGGNVLRCLIWAASGSERRGTVVAAWVGRGVALLTLLSPLALSLVTGVRPELLVYVVAGLVAAMLWTGATAQLRAVDLRARAGSLTAGGLARRAIPVDRDLPLAEAIRRANAAGAGALVVVDPRGVPTGIGQHDAIAAVPEQRRPWVSVASVSRPIDAAGRGRPRSGRHGAPDGGVPARSGGAAGARPPRARVRRAARRGHRGGAQGLTARPRAPHRVSP